MEITMVQYKEKGKYKAGLITFRKRENKKQLRKEKKDVKG